MIAFYVSLLALGAAISAAQPVAVAPAADAPIDLSADGACEVIDNGAIVRCSGGVRIVQGAAILASDRMTVYGIDPDGGFDRIEAVGDVRYSNGENAISGARGTYSALSTELTVTGDVVVIQGDQVLTGGELVYNTETGASRFSPPPGGRVRGLFYRRPG
ncbi:hypothetical protein PB2503_06352 [Parvularcula bermudensis HTCC2503]|uniref:Organic solvent tolerance-like N-terminal domain-containing protein n=1 Tax=Parvularcula bermudensis (strain ATCC BAA-594 / HTCC2503 / KCTC 12087) TaxID=314260 RepID=E0THP0_PARBH|nr:LptA/OstA family protein [Parvularcula bermudensis]ADM09336.1 hypothetical protein PB2503_06352 [Parvularcula bermudensis HTCC2503]